MEEFFRNNYLALTFSVEILAAVTGLFYYNKYKDTAAKYLIYFLLYIVFFELISTYSLFVKNNGPFSFLEGTLFEQNYWLSTLYWSFGAIIFFCFYYQKILKTNYSKLIVKYSCWVFVVISLGKILFNFDDFFTKNFPLISVLGAIVIILCSILYLLEILGSEKILSFYKSLNFYVSVAILIWWLIITPLVFYDIYFGERDWDFIILKWQIYLFSNVLMYLTFTLGLIISKPDDK